MKHVSFSKKLATSVCLAGYGVFLFSCSNMNSPTAVSTDQSPKTTATVYSPWSEKDIGSATGSATPTKNIFMVSGSGADIYGTADAFHFVYRTLNGNGQLIMAPQTITNTNAWAKAGLMIRENLNANSKNMLVAITPGNGVTSQYRNATGGSTAFKAGNAATEKAPYYLKIVRSGNNITTYKSANGTSWTTIETQTISMATSVYIGMAVCSHAGATQCSSNFQMLTPAVIVTQPVSTTACIGSYAGLGFTDDGGVYSYQWYFKSNNSTTFVALSNDANHSGAQAFLMYVYAITGSANTYGSYYCKINYLGMITQTNTVSISQSTGCP
jgi:hypothetical protein